ncbi:MAG: hypothetical protein J6W29_06580, partial [Neisseriaceae bacterium]|nr:hypothetical protein [Neisseriaceae bacterium]
IKFHNLLFYNRKFIHSTGDHMGSPLRNFNISFLQRVLQESLWDCHCETAWQSWQSQHNDNINNTFRQPENFVK